MQGNEASRSAKPAPGAILVMAATDSVTFIAIDYDVDGDVHESDVYDIFQ